MDLNKQKDPSQNDIKFILNLLNSNKLIDAKKEIDKQLTKFPKSSVLFNILGAVFTNEKKLDKAISNYEKAISLNSNYAQAYNNLGIAFHKLNKIDEAIENYKKAINLKNDFFEAFNNLGNAIRELNKFKEALTYYNKALEFNSGYAEAYNNIGATYENLGDKKRALDNYEKAVKLKPDYAEVYNNIGTLLSSLARFDESLINFNKAIELKPDYEKSYNNLGNLFNEIGEYKEANEAYQKAINIKSDYARAYSNLLFNLNYYINYDYNLYLSEAKKFSLNCKPIKKNFSPQHRYEKNPKKLRLGFVSADFGNHPGGFFTLSTFKELRKKNFELIAYPTVERNDEFSPNFRPLFHEWNLIEKKNDENVIKQIVEDKIHILLDIQGHSGRNRLPIFINKPAPIQVTWLGQGSSGISEIDYFIGSPHTTPKNEENHYVEKVLRLPEISQCFTPPNYNILVNNLPALKKNFFTFGCINKLSKVNDNVINLWSKILLSIPNSKIILKNKIIENKNVYEKFVKKFEFNKIKKDRLILLGESKSREDLLKVYNEIDISLDPFPFQGNTSTCESIWMGVPVLTLKGNRYLFHFGESINSNLGMDDWIANNEEEYISKAIKFSSDLEYLSKIRINLRKLALQSPVFDAERFSNHLSDLLWNIWNKFTKKNKF